MTNDPQPTWKELPCSCSSSEERYYHTSTLFKNYIITIGGHSKRLKTHLGIKVLNLNKGSYEDFLLEGDQPPLRHRHSACLLDSNKIITFGGYDNEKLFNETAIITIKETLPLTLTYKKIITAGGKDLFRYLHSADIYQNKMYVFGGRYSVRPMADTNELWSFDLGNWNWQLCKPIGDKPEARSFHSSAIYSNKLYIFGGFSNKKAAIINTCSVLYLKKMQWRNLEIKGMSFLPRSGCSSVILKDTLYIMGGNYQKENQVLAFNFGDNMLTSPDYEGDYIPVAGGTAVAYKDNLILWGGLNSYDESISTISCLQFGETRLYGMYEGENNRFSNHMGSLLNSEEFSDVHFSIEGQEIPAHKNVLAVRCKYFANLFKSGMKESNSSTIQVTTVKLETFQALLKFLYQNYIQLTVPLALDLYAVADEYMQAELMDICGRFLSKNITIDNLMTMIDVVQTFGADSLKSSILEFIVKNFQKLMESQIYNLLPPVYIWEVAAQLLKVQK